MVRIMYSQPIATATTLSLEDKDKLSSLWQPLCQQHNLQFAEYSFANVYLFRKQHSYELIEGDPLFVRGKFSEGHYYLIPTMAPKDLFLKLKSIPKQHCIFPIPDHWVDDFRDAGCKTFFCRGDSDYVYQKEKMQTLKGRALSSRRNLLHQLESHHQMTSRALTENDIPDAFELIEEWQSHSELSKEKTDYFPCREALENMNRLQLFGRIAYADGQAVGFSLGELLTPQTALFHFIKGRRDFKGIMPFLNKDFAQHLPDSVHWINVEQDLGLPALRQAKNAYEPSRLLTKWRICNF